MAFSGGNKKWHFLQKAGITNSKITMNNSWGISWFAWSICFTVSTVLSRRGQGGNLSALLQMEGSTCNYTSATRASKMPAGLLLPEMQSAPGPCTCTASLSSRQQLERSFALLMPTNLPYTVFQEFLLLKRKNHLFLFLYQPRILEKQSCFHNQFFYEKSYHWSGKQQYPK